MDVKNSRSLWLFAALNALNIKSAPNSGSADQNMTFALRQRLTQWYVSFNSGSKCSQPGDFVICIQVISSIEYDHSSK